MNENTENGTTYMPSYTITAMTPKTGGTHYLAEKVLGEPVHIVTMCVGERACFAFDRQSYDRGPYLHLSTVENIDGKIGDEEIQILTRNTLYILKKNH